MWVEDMDERRVLSTVIVDLSNKLPFEGWLVLGWILAISNCVIEMRRRIEGEEKLRGEVGEGVGDEDGRKTD